MGDIAKNFDRKEFACKCGCKFDEINPLVVGMCQDIRDAIGVPLHINSGCRCPKRNEDCGSTSPNHLHGNAVDISTNTRIWDTNALFRLCKELYSKGKLKGIEFCFHEGTWLHIDCDRKRINGIFQTLNNVTDW